jgi:hypothetical protein
MDNCNRDRDDAQHCETRNVAVRATGALSVDGRQNGGIAVHGWDRPDVQVVALIQARAETDAEARDIARQITVLAQGAEVRADGPRMDGGHESWSVSYEIFAPRGTALALTASNGGISVESIASRMELNTVNGGISLTDVGGDVRGTTTNGGITATLSGNRWSGNGLDLRTSNGGVRISIPSTYSANLEAETMNGSIDVDIPVTVQGRLGRQLSTQLGAGGPLIRAVTTNGGVSIRRE